MVDGTPSLISEDAVAEVRFVFPQRRSTKSEAERQYVHYPTSSPEIADTDLPYHLDRAHAAVLLKLKRGARVLEIGCGGGQIRGWLTGRGVEYVGTDISKTRVFEWLQRFGGPDLLCDAHFLPFLDGQFDVVYAAAVTEHTACPMRFGLEVHRVLRPGGYFLGNAAFLEPWHDASHFHVSPDGAVELLLASGFEVDAVWPGRGYHVFSAVLAMTLRGPFRALVPLGRFPMMANRAQNLARRLRWWMRAETPQRQVLLDAEVAGAVDWIAKRPLASEVA
jgi:SAM-dependent methyltransferase